MNAEIEAMIDSNPKECRFTRVPIASDVIPEIEDELGVKLPQQYVDYIMEYGHGGVAGVEILGIGLTGEALFKQATLDYRGYGLPCKFVVVEDVGEWVYCLDCETEHVVSWDQLGGSRDRYSCFDDFLLDEFTEALDNL